jgi:hypothetical protein
LRNFKERRPWTTRELPRVFLSHRRDDEQRALEAASIARDEGFEVWVDIFDPTLAWLNAQGPAEDFKKAVAIASTIEMALLNCSHLCAIWTELTPGSAWVPYEYGRVKDDWSVSDVVCCWTPLEPEVLPSYMHLGKVLASRRNLREWFRQAKKDWPWVAGLALIRELEQDLED